jgi:hypothetical protein
MNKLSERTEKSQVDLLWESIENSIKKAASETLVYKRKDNNKKKKMVQ